MSRKTNFEVVNVGGHARHHIVAALDKFSREYSKKDALIPSTSQDFKIHSDEFIVALSSSKIVGCLSYRPDYVLRGAYSTPKTVNYITSILITPLFDERLIIEHMMNQFNALSDLMGNLSVCPVHVDNKNIVEILNKYGYTVIESVSSVYKFNGSVVYTVR